MKRALGWVLALAVVSVALFSPPVAELISGMSDKRHPAVSFAGCVVLWGGAITLGVVALRRWRIARDWRTVAVLIPTALVALVFWGVVVAPCLAALLGLDTIRYYFTVVFGSARGVDPGFVLLVMSLATAGPVIAGVAAWRLGARARHAAVFLGLIAPVYVYLVKDDTELRNPIELAEFSPGGPEPVAAERVFLNWAAGTDAERAFKAPAVFVQIPPTIESEEWVDWVTQNRAEIARAWKEIEPLRTWWAEWNRYPAVADTTDSYDSPIPSFKVLRTLARAVCAEATARALEGRGDEALELLAPFIEGADKLQAHSVTLVRSMCAHVMRGMAVDTVNVVLDRSRPGAAARERLREALAPTLRGEGGARRLVAGEFALQIRIFRNQEAAYASSKRGGTVMRWIRPMVLNPRRTYNEIGDVAAETMERAARRDQAWLREEKVRRLAEKNSWPGVKNPGRRVWTDIMAPGYDNVVESYWKLEDATAALLARLDASAAADSTAAKEEKP